MAFRWTPDQIRWYENASKYSAFHKNLAAILIPFLEAEDTICDWGAGLGKVSLELAPHVTQVICVDSDKAVLDMINREAIRRSINNFKTYQADAQENDIFCDVGLMIFFGTPFSLMKRCMERSRRLLIRVMNSDLHGRPHGRETAGEIEQALALEGYRYSRQELEFEFGQPFTSFEDACHFALLYQSERTDDERAAYLKEMLQLTGNETYPYYLPKNKSLAVFIIETDKRT
ncbi:MAG: hypothetical protein GX850_05185 [Clostridiaceae bacterium]|nr:hypothetical protein [Clostridiaceae bacterium]